MQLGNLAMEETSDCRQNMLLTVGFPGARMKISLIQRETIYLPLPQRGWEGAQVIKEAV